MKTLSSIIGVLAVSTTMGCSGQPIQPGRLAVGQPVTLEGFAEARKLGAALRGEYFDVWIEGLQNWPSDHVGRKVRVIGVVAERHDLPVHVHKPGESAAGGIPVPEGTDLRAASRRYVIRDAKWSLIP